MGLDHYQEEGSAGESEKSAGAKRTDGAEVTRSIDVLKGGITQLLESSSDNNVASHVVRQLAEHPDLLSEMATWNVLRLKWEDADQDYIAFLRGLADGSLLNDISSNLQQRLRLEASIRLGDQLRRSRDDDVFTEGIALLEEVVDAVEPDTQELWQQRLLGTAHYNLATASVKHREPNYEKAEDHYTHAIQHSADAGHLPGVLQNREARAYWVYAQSDDTKTALRELKEVLMSVTEHLRNSDGADSLGIAELRNTQANAALNFIFTRNGIKHQAADRQQTAAEALNMFPFLESNDILKRLAESQ